MPAMVDSVAQASAAVALPRPRTDSGFSIERALHGRRSAREFRNAALTQEEVAQLLWAGQGVTSREGLRTAPSAGALYPLELYLALGRVQGLEAGIYKYVAPGHRLVPVAPGDARPGLAAAATAQDFVAQAAVVLVFAAAEARTTRKYGTRGVRYVHFEVGHAAQNVALQAAALGLGTVTVGAFDDEAVRQLLRLPAAAAPLYIMPIGRS